MNKAEYNVIKNKIEVAEKEYHSKNRLADKFYKDLIKKNFDTMKHNVSRILRDTTFEEFIEWLSLAKEDDGIDYKIFLLVQLSWLEVHKDEMEKIDSRVISDLVDVISSFGR